MNGWMTFWTWALLIGLSFFAVVVITVTIGGLRDIRHMLRSLQAGHERGDGDAEYEDRPGFPVDPRPNQPHE